MKNTPSELERISHDPQLEALLDQAADLARTLSDVLDQASDRALANVVLNETMRSAIATICRLGDRDASDVVRRIDVMQQHPQDLHKLLRG